MKENIMNCSKFFKIIAIPILIFWTTFFNSNALNYNLNLIGHLCRTSSISRHTESFIDCLANEIDIQFVYSANFGYQAPPRIYKKIIATAINPYRNKRKKAQPVNKSISGISIFTGLLFPDEWAAYAKVEDNSIIKLAYCVTESTLEKQDFIQKLNQHFDAILVPDEWLINIYKNSGLKLPIFLLPLTLKLHNFFTHNPTEQPPSPFIFGFSGAFWPRKNHELLIKAFTEEFGNDSRVLLKIHARKNITEWEDIATRVMSLQSNNIICHHKRFSQAEYESFLKSLNCFVTISKGEGFSVIPREALACGIPCIVSNNTAHQTICATGYVYPIASEQMEECIDTLSGYNYNCNIIDIRKALRTVYENYQTHFNYATQGREWVKQYLPENLKNKYKTVIAPGKVILGDCNQITDEYLMTDSKELFEKYKTLCGKTKTIFVNSKNDRNI